ncbi:MAG TPA: ABC transporter substrate-binding protein [Candidatus Lustribacter sp.]|jgi:branched-chain amino acid transport system substrate-binding protein|nr:ABC transporter substrate-binding protein [Candidatus Lustribacter sp.]
MSLSRTGRTAALVIAAILGCLAASRAASPAPSKTPFTIDVIVSQTGQSAFQGQQAIAAIRAVESAINADGGINGQPVRFQLHDDETKPQVAVEVGTQILAGHPAILLGPIVQATCNALAPIAGTATVEYCLSPGLVPEARSYVFSSSASLVHVMPAQFRYERTAGRTRVGILVSTDATGQRSDKMIDYTLHLPENKALVPVDYEHFNDSDISVAAQLARIKAADPQFLYVSASGTPFQTILRGILDAGMGKLPIVTSAANMESGLLAPWVKTPPDQLTFNGPRFWGTVTDPDPRVRAAIASYHAAFKRMGAEPTPNDEFYWDPAQIAVDAYRHLGTAATAAQVHDYIENLHDFAGIAGLYDFRGGDQHGLGDEATVILQWDPVKSTFFPVSAPGGVALHKVAS